MKISCIPICLFNEILNTKSLPVESWIRMAVELELDGIEMYEPYLASWEPAYMTKLSDLIQSVGLEISMFTSYCDFSSPESPKRAEQTERVNKAVDAAVLFRTNTVRVTAGSWIEGLSREEVLQNIADGLRGCLDYAEKRGVTLALEDHPVVGTKIIDFMRILELVDDERLKVNLDTSNPLVSGDSAVELVKLVKNRVVHLHASDRDKTLDHVIEGTGIVDFPEIFKVLKSTGYDGWISLEAGGKEGKEGIRKGIEYIKWTWEKS